MDHINSVRAALKAASAKGNKLSFRLPSIGASWTGTVGSDRTFTGTWQQGSQTQPLNLGKK